MTADRPCPRCERITSLPFMCRRCWSAMGYDGQRQFYATQSHQTQPRWGESR